MKHAQYYEKSGNSIACRLCPHRCVIEEGASGLCGVRTVISGELVAATYGQVSAFGIDPIEKKPLYHFMPGSKIASFGGSSCNMSCAYCQNHHISQTVGFHVQTSPQDLIRKSLEDKSSIGLAATYNEPIIQYEFISDVFELNHKIGRKNVLITNGYIEQEPLSELVQLVDAFNVDLKGFNQAFYRDICGADLQPVLNTLAYLYDRSHLEISCLIIPNYNDAIQDLTEMFKAIRAISPDIPVHLTRYMPKYKMNEPETPLAVLKGAKELADKYLKHVYIGNVPEVVNETVCQSCGYVLVARDRHEVRISVSDDRCPSCGKFHHLILD